MSTPTTTQGAQPTHSHPPPIRENIQMHSGQIPTAATPDTASTHKIIQPVHNQQPTHPHVIWAHLLRATQTARKIQWLRVDSFVLKTSRSLQGSILKTCPRLVRRKRKSSVMQAPPPRAWDAIQVSVDTYTPPEASFERFLDSEHPTIVFCSRLPEVRRRSTAYIVIDAGFHVQDDVYLIVRTRPDGRTLVFTIQGGRCLDGSPVLYTVGNRDGRGIMLETCPFRLRIIRPRDANSLAPHIVAIIHINAHRATYIPSNDSDDDL